MAARLCYKRHPGREPDSFRLTDPTGEILGVFQVEMVAPNQKDTK
jgi:hypothetical protein